MFQNVLHSDYDATALVHRPCIPDNFLLPVTGNTAPNSFMPVTLSEKAFSLFPVISNTAPVSSEPVTLVDSFSSPLPIDISTGHLDFIRPTKSRITFEVDTGATHSMLGSLELCRAILADFDASRILMISAPGGQIVYGKGCGRLIEGGILTEEIWCVPAIGDRGLLSTSPAVSKGVSCALRQDGVVFSKDGVTLLKGRLDRSTRNFKVDISLNTCCEVTHSSIVSNIPHPPSEHVSPFPRTDTDSDCGYMESSDIISSQSYAFRGVSSAFPVLA